MDATCICSSIQLLAKGHDEDSARALIPALNCHLEDLRRLLAQSKSLSRDVRYRVTPRNERTGRVLSVTSAHIAPVNRIRELFGDTVGEFWVSSDGRVSTELRRRLACVVIFLRSKLSSQASVPPQLAGIFHKNYNYTDIRNCGSKYLQIARKLGGLGSILWLPLDIPSSTYERYLNLDDEEVFHHLASLTPRYEDYTALVQRLILSQLLDPTLPPSYLNLFAGYADILPAPDQLLLLLHALGGSDIPEKLLKSVRLPQRRWDSNGEIQTVTAAEFGLPSELINILSDQIHLSRAAKSPYIIRSALDDTTIVWSLCPDYASILSRILHPRTADELGDTALKLICYVCPPCYEGNTDWSPVLKQAVWPIVQRVTKRHKIPPSLRVQVLETLLFFGERDSVAIRRVAVEQAKGLLRKSMPYYLHASVALFRSTLHRVDADFAKSESYIRDFTWRGPRPTTRRDHALQGRLHISQMENKIKCYDNDVPSSIYGWKADQPLSALDIEVTFRLQSTAARFFQSVGDFGAARDSLEQILSLDTTKPIRGSTRRVLVGRLADTYCEMGDCAAAAEMVRAELDNMNDSQSLRREFRRLMLASAEANIGLEKLGAAESALEELEGATLPRPDNLHDQQLHMRALLAAARIAHSGTDRGWAVLRWKSALEEVQRMHTLGSGGGFTAAVIHVSLAHAQLAAGDGEGGRRSWATGMELMRSQTCEYWLPVVPTAWLQRIAREVHDSQGWLFRMKLPGARCDITWT
ncbi:ABC multidrug transporter [Colletotrichum higginsianum IMI 349063]|uniref:ABC multidrug transporter n=1 Tax=Colletotrichum higginsianum (strain IMI 349063) TaxID=759273 RepID=A0A1B7YB75_COLHI|nr:ABC multidrug transporter [Colletotrichum higginsianum IMI 349063]OBR09148.1 ABC multidrug transporter [Colletotrichum higginsianum IMI 349063]